MRVLLALTIAMLPLAAHAGCTTIGATVTCDTPEEAQSLSGYNGYDSFQRYSDRLEAQDREATQALIDRRNAEEDGYMQGCADAGGRC